MGQVKIWLLFNNFYFTWSILEFFVTNGLRYSRMDEVKFCSQVKKTAFKKFEVICLLKACIPEILLGPFLNSLTQMSLIMTFPEFE